MARKTLAFAMILYQSPRRMACWSILGLDMGQSGDVAVKSVKQNLQKLAAKHCGETCRAEIEAIIEARNLIARYRPVAALGACQVFAQWVRVTAPIEQAVRDPAALFAAARRAELAHKLAKRFFDCALGGFADASLGTPGRGGRLIVPLPVAAIEALGAGLAEALEKSLKKAELAADALILLHPGFASAEGEAMSNVVEFTQAASALGVVFARQGLACDLAEDALWADTAAALCVLNAQHLEDVEAGSPSVDRLRALLSQQRKRGRKILAPGVHSQAALDVARALEIELVCGDFIGRPSRRPYDMLSAAAFKSLREQCVCESSCERTESLLGRLLFPLAPVTPKTPAEEVFHFFEQQPDIRALAVVEDGRPLGIISRYEMVDHMARPYRHELFGRKSCTRFMDPEPLVFDVHIGLAELMDQVVQAHPRHLISGFIVTEAGRYLGMGAVQDLMREITAMQIDSARHANPLTQLPGNVPINQHIDTLLENGIPCAVAYCDLDHFKPFNDTYGYAKGDEIIRLTAQVLAECVVPEIDFLGHVGGDDFVVVFLSPDWQARCERALDRFAAEVTRFFSPEDLARGGYESPNRKGEMEFHPLTSLSIGALECPPGQYSSHLEVASVAAEVKKKAKAVRGNSLYVNQRRV